MRCADRQARTSPIDQVEVHQLGESLFERRRRVVAGAVGAKWKGIPGMGKRVRREKAGNALGQRAPRRVQGTGPESPSAVALWAAAECVQPLKSVLRLVSGNKTRFDGADRGPDDQVRLDPGLL